MTAQHRLRRPTRGTTGWTRRIAWLASGLALVTACSDPAEPSDPSLGSRSGPDASGTGVHVCTGAPGDDDLPCDDGNPCTGADRCKAGACAGLPVGLVYGGAQAEVAHAVLQAADGGLVLVGETSTKGQGAADLWLVRTDGQGKPLWDRTFGGPKHDAGYAALILPDGGLVIAGKHGASLDVQGADTWLVRTDAKGNLLWEKSYPSPGIDLALAVVRAPGGGFVLAGLVGPQAGGATDAAMVRVDEAGKLLQDLSFGGKQDDEARALLSVPDGYFLAGTTRSKGKGQSDAWLVRTDAAGKQLWDVTYGGAGNDGANGAALLPDGGVVLAGFTYSTGKGKADLWVARTDPAGKALWEHTWGTAEADGANAVALLSAGTLGLAAETNATSLSDRQSWLLVVDLAGKFVAEHTYGKAGAGQHFANALASLPNSGFALAGATDALGQGALDMWLVRADAKGKSTCE